jgi:hypothetical protein
MVVRRLGRAQFFAVFNAVNTDTDQRRVAAVSCRQPEIMSGLLGMLCVRIKVGAVCFGSNQNIQSIFIPFFTSISAGKLD